MVDDIIDFVLGAALSIFSEKHPEKAAKITGKISEEYNKNCNKVYKEYDKAEKKAYKMSNSELKDAYNNADNNIKKYAYGQEIKDRINENKAKEPKYKPIDGYK